MFETASRRETDSVPSERPCRHARIERDKSTGEIDLQTEKRRHTRFTARLRVEIEADEKTLVGHTHDLSLGGMFVESWESIAVGTKVTVSMTLPAIGTASKIQCTVRWVIPGGMGLSYGDLGAAETWAINQLAILSTPKK